MVTKLSSTSASRPAFHFKPGEWIPGLPEGKPASHSEFLYDRARVTLHPSVRDVLTRFNPYTKKLYADNPTITLLGVPGKDLLF